MILLTMMIPQRWFEEVAAELEDKREVGNNLREEGEDIVLDFEMEEVQPLKAKK